MNSNTQLLTTTLKDWLAYNKLPEVYQETSPWQPQPHLSTNLSYLKACVRGSKQLFLLRCESLCLPLPQQILAWCSTSTKFEPMEIMREGVLVDGAAPEPLEQHRLAEVPEGDEMDSWKVWENLVRAHHHAIWSFGRVIQNDGACKVQLKELYQQEAQVPPPSTSTSSRHK
ncbi:hypothetical protein MJO28_013231 [Puccinia striiformis f. sp. tritici]|uniref:Uncharacterized protein n=1 Tax=Puccinia striiformis f. sp. tritici TaxID=168172 RepID=A0ACC0DXX6_9BASI|nr:hypothetical protein MJO28_013231 [Puccinia striiformis f. sp. tritici]